MLVLEKRLCIEKEAPHGGLFLAFSHSLGTHILCVASRLPFPPGPCASPALLMFGGWGADDAGQHGP